MTNQSVKQLQRILDFVYRFPYNVSAYDVVRLVYGTDANPGYLKSKEDFIIEKGLPRWYCDLDLGNQEKLASLILERYYLHGLLEALQANSTKFDQFINQAIAETEALNG